VRRDHVHCIVSLGYREFLTSISECSQLSYLARYWFGYCLQSHYKTTSPYAIWITVVILKTIFMLHYAATAFQLRCVPSNPSEPN